MMRRSLPGSVQCSWCAERMNANAPRPWYREPWLWAIMAGPAIVIVAGAVTVYLAVSSDDGLVSGDYYRQGLAINQRLEKEQRAAESELSVGLEVGVYGDAVTAILNGRAESPKSLRLTLVHRAGRDIEQSVLLRAKQGGRFEGRLNAARGAGWRVVIEDEPGQWRLSGEWPGAGGRSTLAARR